MSETTVAFLTALVPVVGVFVRWMLRLWATVRREAIISAAKTADRNIEAILEQARSNALLAAKTDQLIDSNQALLQKFDDVMDKLESVDRRLEANEKWHEQTVYRPRRDG